MKRLVLFIGLVIGSHLALAQKSGHDLGNVQVYPNPANEEATFVSESKGEVIVMDALGQIVDTFTASANTPVKISTSNFRNGVYFIKQDGKTIRFVVRH